MKNHILIFFTLVYFLSVNGVRAVYKMGEERPVPTSGSSSLKETKKVKFPSSKTKEPGVEQDVLAGLSEMFSVPIDRLQYFRKLRHGYEEIVPSLIVAREAQVEPGRVLKSRMDGKSWKTIADSFSIDLNPLNKEVVEVLKPIRKVLPKQALIERPQTRN